MPRSSVEKRYVLDRYTKIRSRGVGFYHEGDDCTVHALQHAHDLTYREAHALLKHMGREDAQGVPFFQFGDVFMTRVPLPKATYKKFNGDTAEYNFSVDFLTVKQFLDLYPKGHYIANVDGHVFAVKDGYIFDFEPIPVRKRIYAIWAVKHSATELIAAVEQHPTPVFKVK